MGQFIQTDAADTSRLHLSGDWVLDNLSAIRKELSSVKNTEIANADIGALDTAGAMLLSRFETIDGLKDWQNGLVDLIRQSAQDYPEQDESPASFTKNLIALGKAAHHSWHNTIDLFKFIGETFVYIGALFANPARLRFRSLLRHIHETGVMAVPIVSLIAFLISIVLAYQGADQLKRFGAEIFAINMVAISVLREMGVLLTSIMVAGRSGSAFTAEIGVMKVTEEVDAMQIMGIKPFEYLVLPRILALMVTLPLLTFIADIMGLLGGGIISYFQMGISPEQYLDRFRGAISMSDFWVGIVKAPVFAFFIAIVGCMRGLQVSGSAESVGKLTTISVVQSIFLVLLLDALFSILFTKLGI